LSGTRFGRRHTPIFAAGIAVVFATVGSAAIGGSSHSQSARRPRLAGIHKIRHVVVIMQENRSFDSYFGTYPGADGIPMRDGVPKVCLPDPATHRCVRPFHDTQDRNGGGPHDHVDAVRDIDHGRMDGFIRRERAGLLRVCRGTNDPLCTAHRLHQETPDVMGYHDPREIPNYWTYARNYVLQDHMFEPDTSWSLRRTCSSSRAGRRGARDRETPRAAATRTRARARRRARFRTQRAQSPTTPGPTTRTSSPDTMSAGATT
jgi:hypothetical protein